MSYGIGFDADSLHRHMPLSLGCSIPSYSRPMIIIGIDAKKAKTPIVMSM